MKKLLLLLFTILLLAVQPIAYAQSVDPYTLTPQQLQMFRGYQATTSAGLFDGSGQMNNGLFGMPSTQLGGAAPHFDPVVSNDDQSQHILLTSQHGDMIFTYVAGIPYNKFWDTAGGFKRFAAWLNEMHSYGIPDPDAARIALAWTKKWCSNPNASPHPAPTNVEQCGFDFTDVDPDEGAGPFNDQCQVWGSTFFPDWKNHGGEGRAVNCTPPPPAQPLPKRNGMEGANATQCGTTKVNAQEMGGDTLTGPGDTLTCKPLDEPGFPFTYDQPKEGWKLPMTLTAKNVGETKVEKITLHADLADHNGLMADNKAPTPPYPDPPFDTGSDMNGGLIWTTIKGAPFTLVPAQSQSFVWAVYPLHPNSILRWKFTAEFGAGESILLHWIPVQYPVPKNPYPDLTTTPGLPVAGGGGGGGVSPVSCAQPTPTSNIPDTLQKTFNLKVVGLDDQHMGWTWEALCGYSSTNFVSLISGGWMQVLPSDGSLGRYSFQNACPGDGSPSVYMANYQPEGFFKYMIAHEFGHVIEHCTPTGRVALDQTVNATSQEGAVSWYGANGGCTGSVSRDENFADMVAYYLNKSANYETSGCPGAQNLGNPFYPTNTKPLHFTIAQTLLGNF
jgi:hypothetical protein